MVGHRGNRWSAVGGGGSRGDAELAATRYSRRRSEAARQPVRRSATASEQTEGGQLRDGNVRLMQRHGRKRAKGWDTANVSPGDSVKKEEDRGDRRRKRWDKGAGRRGQGRTVRHAGPCRSGAGRDEARLRGAAASPARGGDKGDGGGARGAGRVREMRGRGGGPAGDGARGNGGAAGLAAARCGTAGGAVRRGDSGAALITDGFG